ARPFGGRRALSIGRRGVAAREPLRLDPGGTSRARASRGRAPGPGRRTAQRRLGERLWARHWGRRLVLAPGRRLGLRPHEVGGSRGPVAPAPPVSRGSAPGSPGGPAWTPAPRRPPRLF